MDTPVLSIQTDHFRYVPVVAEAVRLAFSRAGAPGTLTFQVVKEPMISFHEGDAVRLTLGGDTLFLGFVFTKRRQSGGVIAVTAYDQLRYLKNRDSYTYEQLTATELLRRVAQDTGLVCGALQDTGYRIPSRIENGKTLFDIIQTALDLTAKQTGQVFVLYDDAGALQLRHVLELTLDCLIHTGAIAEFDYTSSIDQSSYSAVKLHRDAGGGGETVFYAAQDAALLQRWGRLQLYEKLEEDADGPEAARALLALYGCKTRTLHISDAVGDRRCRGGSLLPVELDLGDIVVSEFLMAEHVVHSFSEGGHLMDLTLVGGEFVD